MEQQQGGLEAMLTALVLVKGGTQKDVDRLMTDAGAADLDRVATMLVGGAGAMKLTLDYGKSDAEYAARFTALADEGQYAAHRNPDATPQHFASNRRGVQELDIIMFEPKMPPEGQDQWLTSEQVLAQMDAAELEPEDALVTLAIAKDKRGDFFYGCFGSVWSHSGELYVLNVSSDGGRRGLDVRWVDSLWFAHWRFPACRKGSR
jgi:hypothetical protein